MARYIDADALIAEYDRVHVGSAGGARKLMVEAPTVDVVEVKHAYWKTVTETKNNTVCGDGVQIQKKVCSNCEQPMGVCGTDYCGYCGAIMDAKSREGNIITQKNIAKLERAMSIIEKAGINSRDTRSSLVSAIALINSVLWEVKKMTDHKYTDEEVIRALKICTEEGDCEGCCYRYLECSDCVNAMNADALDLINRQRAEIEGVQSKRHSVKFKTGDYAKIARNVSEHKFEIDTIVKLEKFDDNYKAFANGDYWWVIDDDLMEIDDDNLVKEIAGGENENIQETKDT